MTKFVVATPLTNRENPALANLDDRFVFILGGTFRTKSTTDFYHIAHDVWTKGPLMTTPRYNLSACILAGFLYAFNGATPRYDSIESINAQSLVNGQVAEWKRI